MSQGGQTSASPKAAPPSQHGGYALHPEVFSSEDILFYIDVGPETMVEMKVNGPNGRPYTRLDSIKQAILLFINAKLTINSDHRFAFAALAKSTYWVGQKFIFIPDVYVLKKLVDEGTLAKRSEKYEVSRICVEVWVSHKWAQYFQTPELQKEFCGDVGSAVAALMAITVDSSSSRADLTRLFKVSTHEAKKSRGAQNRLFRVVIDNNTVPTADMSKIFTLDVMYLHDKPGPDNCSQTVYDSLVEALEQISEYEGYIFESGQGLTRALFRHRCVLLSHPQQRCMQDDVDLPKSLTKKSPVAESAPTDDNVVVSC